MMDKTDKLLLTGYNRMMDMDNIIALRTEENLQSTYSVLAEKNDGEILTLAVISTEQIAQQFLQRLYSWLNSSDDFPFHVQYEVNRIQQQSSVTREGGKWQVM